MNHLLSRLALGTTLAAVSIIGMAQDGRYIVKFAEGKAAAGRAALHAGGAQVVLSLDSENAAAAHIPEQALFGLSHNPNIEYIEVDALRFPMATWSDRTRSGSAEVVPYGIQMVQADLVNTSNQGAIKVCIIDSGYSQSHEDLPDGVTSTATTGTGSWNKDSCGHGSHVAGTVLATAGNGVGVVGAAPGAALHVVKVFGDDNLTGGNCAWTYSSTLVNALAACRSAGAKVVSMSLGGATSSRTEDNAFATAYNAGVLSIAAAGNDGSKRTSYPAGYASVVSVAAVDSTETVATFSQQNKDVELAAPGVAVLSSVPFVDVDTLTVNGVTVSGGHVEFSARTPGVSGTVVDGGLCTAAGAWSGKIVLCQRGTNSFLQKVQAVQSGGGNAAVIYNAAASDPTCGDLLATLGDGNSSTIPAIGVSCADGSAALAQANQAGTVVSQLNAPASGYEAWDGTSMATPHVSGVAALVWSCFPTKTNVQIRNALTATALHKGAAGRNAAYGYGIVQAKNAVLSLGATSCTTVATSKY